MSDPRPATSGPFLAETDAAAGERAAPTPDVAGPFRNHNQTLVRFLKARLGSEQEAKEVAQEAYVKLLQLERAGAISFMRAYRSFGAKIAM